MGSELIGLLMLSLLIFCGCGFMIYHIYYEFIYPHMKPKYRVSKDNKIEYYNGKFCRWMVAWDWDENPSDRVIIIHCHKPIEIKYNGPGRIYYQPKDNVKLTQQQMSELFNFKTAKEMYEYQDKLIDDENTLVNKITEKRIVIKEDE
jgi:hypothetical protein